MTVLHDLFYGKIHLDEKCYDSRSAYADFMKILSDNEEQLLAILGALPDAEEKKRVLSRLTDAQDELCSLAEYERFAEGFRLGAGLMLETFVLPQSQ